MSILDSAASAFRPFVTQPTKFDTEVWAYVPGQQEVMEDRTSHPQQPLRFKGQSYSRGNTVDKKEQRPDLIVVHRDANIPTAPSRTSFTDLPLLLSSG